MNIPARVEGFCEVLLDLERRIVNAERVYTDMIKQLRNLETIILSYPPLADKCEETGLYKY